ncbi:MAG: OmpA family protein [Candidatus Eisenbacteria bacterium]
MADFKRKDEVLLERKGSLSRVMLSESALFASGSTRLTSHGKQIIDKIAGVLADYPDHEVFIEGHTDNVPIASRYQNRFRSNWELSAARSLSVLHYIREKHRIDPKRLAVVGYGEHRPVAENATEHGRAQNRRVVLAIMKPL